MPAHAEIQRSSSRSRLDNPGPGEQPARLDGASLNQVLGGDAEPGQGLPVPRPSGLSLGRNFAWALAGNGVYALCQWGMIIALARLSNSYMVGQFSLGLAIAAPVLMMANLQLRSVQATDAQNRYSFGEYLGLRLVTTTAAVAVIAFIVFERSIGASTAMVVLAVASAKALESVSDIFYGLFQLNDRLDFVGSSMMLKGVLSIAALAAGLSLTHDVFWGVASMALAWLATLIFFDVRSGAKILFTGGSARRWVAALAPRFHLQRQAVLARVAFPLGIVMALVALNMHMPRYFVQLHQGESRLGIFSTMAYAMVAVTTVVDALGHSATPRLSRLFSSGHVHDFRALLGKLAGLGIAVGVVAMATVMVAGEEILAMLYGHEYAPNASVLFWLTAGAGVSGLATALTYGITSANCFRAQVPMFAAVVGVNAAACAVLIPRYGLMGAAFAQLIASSLHVTMAALVVIRLLAQCRKSREYGPAAAGCWETGV